MLREMEGFIRNVSQHTTRLFIAFLKKIVLKINSEVTLMNKENMLIIHTHDHASQSKFLDLCSNANEHEMNEMNVPGETKVAEFYLIL